MMQKKTLKSFSALSGKRVFLAAPYTHDDPLVRAYRVSQVNACAAELMLAGALVFSPVSMTHPISHFTHEPVPHKFWLRQTLSFIEWADTFAILRLQGWKVSSGLDEELRAARSKGLEIVELDNFWGADSAWGGLLTMLDELTDRLEKT